jgi:CheY-like chemotaxis protein
MASAEDFREAGWQVLEASNGQAAIEAHRAADNRLDVLFTDIQLGNSLSGWDVADAIRGAQADAHVVYTSGNPVDRQRQVSGSCFFSKPYNVADVIEACCQAHRSGRGR